MYLSITFGGLWYKNLRHVLKLSIKRIKLLGPCLRLEVNSRGVRVKHIIVSVSRVEVWTSSVLYVLLCIVKAWRRAKIE